MYCIGAPGGGRFSGIQQISNYCNKAISQFEFGPQNESEEVVNLYPDDIDFRGINKWINEGLKTLWKKDKPSDEWLYVTEEISELIIEIANFQKALCKAERGKVSKDAIFEEAVDVLTALLVFFIRDDFPIGNILNMVEYKIRRAVERYQLNGEL